MYEVSEFGHVRRAKNIIHHRVGHRKKPAQLLAPHGKYGTYGLMSDKGKITIWRTNRLVLMVFVGPPPTAKHQAAHWDDNKSNNHISNLRWATALENAADKKRNGLTSLGERNGSAKLTSVLVSEIRQKYSEEDVSLKELSRMYGISLAPLHAAVIGKSWSHVPGAVAKRGQGTKAPSRVLRGEKNANSKLTLIEVREIKRLLPTTKGVTLAKMFCTTIHTISAIKRGVVWNWVD